MSDRIDARRPGLEQGPGIWGADPTAAVALRRAQRLVLATSRTPLPPPGRSPTRIETAQRRFLREGNLDLILPLRWAVYGDQYSIVR